jgi:hypothetical protein
MNMIRITHQPSRMIGLLFLFLAVFWAGCSVTEPGEPASSITETVTSTIAPSVSPSSTPQPTRTATTRPTVSPAHTATAELIPSPAEATATRSPTLAPDERNAFILDLFLNNGGCALPCFWGFTPGETRWDEARQVLEQLNDNIFEVNMGKGKYRYEVELQNWKDDINLGANFLVQDGIIEYVSSQQLVYRGSPHLDLLQNQFSLNNLFTKNYVPDKIRILLWDLEDNEIHPQYISIYFYQDKVNFAYWLWSGNVRKKGDQYQICPNEPFSISELDPFRIFYIVASPNFDITIEKIRQDYFQGQSVKIFPLEEATGISNEEFARMGLDGDPKVCLNIDPDKWP